MKHKIMINLQINKRRTEKEIRRTGLRRNKNLLKQKNSHNMKQTTRPLNPKRKEI